MSHLLHGMRAELRPMLRLAIPLVLAELGWIFMVIVDTVMVGHIPGQAAESIGAVSLGGVIYFAVGLFGMGVLLGLDTFVSQSFGAERIDECHRHLVDAIWLTLGITLPLMAAIAMTARALSRVDVNPVVLGLTLPYMRALNWGTLPLLLYFAFRRYLQGMNLVRPVTFALVSANLVNLLGNWLLIYGHWGFPPMGVEGSGWSTCWARAYLAGVLGVYIVWYDHRHKTELRAAPRRPELARIWRLLLLGLPAALQMTLEVAVFAIATALIARFDPISLAAHQVTLNTASFTYMVPVGIASSAAVRVGQALGRRDNSGALQAGWTGIALASLFMTIAGILMLTVPTWIARVYTNNAAVIHSSVVLLAIASAFQLFDGIQAAATGALRGTGDTRTPMFAHVGCYWLVGLPVGYWLCFRRGWGAAGIWMGLCIAIILIGSILLTAWSRQIRLR